MDLTKDADLLVCSIYQEYIFRRKSGCSKRNAIEFQSDSFRTSGKISSWLPEDFFSTLSELKEAGFVMVYINGNFCITNKLIVYMESRFKNGILEITDFITKFIP
nr:MAG TPA: hypothetical protein [Caudoviricetes sp.]